MNKWYSNQIKIKDKFIWKPKDDLKKLQWKELTKMFNEFLKHENKEKGGVGLEERLGEKKFSSDK